MASTIDNGPHAGTREKRPPTSGSGSPQPVRGASIPLGNRQTSFSRSYGVLVSWLKVLLPTIAVSLTILVIAWPHLEDQERRFGERLIGLETTQAKNLEVVNPRYNGMDEKGNPFNVSAEVARQAEVDSPVVDLKAPKADIQLGEDNWALISAVSGKLDRDANLLELYEEVNLFHDLGYEFHTKNITIDLIAGSAYGFDPVWGQGPFGRLEAEGVQIFDRGSRVQLTGKAKIIVNRDPEAQ